MELSLWSFVFKPVSLEFLVRCHAELVRIKDAPYYTWRGHGTCRNADKRTFIWVEMVRPVIVQKFDNGLNVSFIPSDVQVWVSDCLR